MIACIPRRQCGFTLMELTVVLVIVALLLGGLMIPLSTQKDVKGRQDTEKALSEIREALIGFAVVNGRLPCPATPNIAAGAMGAGLEVRQADPSSPPKPNLICSNVAGVLPWATLGLPETDAWGRRYSYRVSAIFARSVDTDPSSPPISYPYGGTCAFTTTSEMPTKSAFALCSQGDVSIRATTGAALASNVPAVVVSHGKSGLGAWLPLGTQVAGATGDEAENANADAIFVSDTSIDDQITWLSLHGLMNRMIAAGKLP